MSRIRATFHYAPRGLLIEPAVLGHSFGLVVNGYEMTVTFPLAAAESDESSASPAPQFDEYFPEREKLPLVGGAKDIFVTMMSEPADGPTIIGIDKLRVEVFIDDASFGASDYSDGGATSEVSQRARSEIEQARRAAVAAVERLLAWSRVLYGQVWLGLGGEPVKEIGSDEVVDVEAGLRLPWPARMDMTFRMVDPSAVLDLASIERLRPLQEGDALPDLADTLLADARFLASTADPPDPSRALLIAAVACEVKIKATLVALATPEQAPLAQLLLSRPRDWSLAASALFNEPLKIIGGKSLKDEKALWKRVIDLFEGRNDLAHRGHVPTEKQGKDAVDTAREVFTWLGEHASSR
jgi:hypothetical protein